MTPWQLTHGEDFDGLRLPFGCQVAFKPNPTKDMESHKMVGDTVDGIFAGYELGPGYTWTGQYRIWALEDVRDTDLSKFADALSHKHSEMHKAKVVEVHQNGIFFPLKEEYDRLNHTLDGLREVSERENSNYSGAPATSGETGDHWTQLGPERWCYLVRRK